MSATPEPPAQHRQPVDATGAVHLCLLLGRILFSFGATTQRIQDSIAWLARYLGCKVHTLVSYDALLITIDDGATFRTRIDSSRSVAGLNLSGLARVSELLRSMPPSQCDAKEIEGALCTIRDTPPAYAPALQAIACGCAGTGFCMVNGGDPASWLCSFIGAALIFLSRRTLAGRKFNIHLTMFAASLVGSFSAGLLGRIMQTSTPVIAVVAPALVLVPGVPLINGGIDIVRNHVTTGIARIGFTLAVIVDLCLGAGLAVPVFSLRVSPPFSLPGAGQVVLVSAAGALAAAALALLNNGGLPFMLVCALGGLTCRLVRAISTNGGLDLITASLIGVLCSTLVVSFIAERLRWPAVVASVLAALPMVPGYFAIAGLHGVLSSAAADAADPARLSAGIHSLARALFISIALVVGIIGPVIILEREKERV